MPIISNFPGGSGSGGGGGLALGAVSNIKTLTASGKVYVKWTDPDDMVVGEATLAAWGGTLLVRKAGSMPTSRRDGTTVLDSKERNKYQNAYFCDTGLTNGTQYFYKMFPYTTTGTYTNSGENEFSATPNAVLVGNVTGMSAVAAGNGKLNIKWTDPDATVMNDGVALATWESTTVVVKAGSYATSPEDGAAAFTKKSTTRNEYAVNALTVTGLENGTTYYISFFPTTTDGAVNTNEANRITGIPNRLQIAKTPSQSGTLTYNENSQTPNWNDYNKSQLTIGGDTSGINAGEYRAEFTPTDDYCWSDNMGTETRTVVWKIGKATISVPTTSSTFTYDGGVKTPVWSGYDAKKMTLGGTYSETNAGDYKATFTPTANYQWTDGSVNTKEVSWSIAKAPCNLTVSPNAVTLDSSNLSATVTVTRLGNGTVTAVSNATDVATVSVSNPTGTNPVITINNVNQNTGTTTITVKSAASANYAASVDQTITVTAQFMPSKKELDDMSWSDISTVSEAGKAAEYWKVGDRKGIVLNGTVGTLNLASKTLYVYILGFDHNSDKEGRGIHFGTFKDALTNGNDVCLVDSKYNGYDTGGTKYFNMNHKGNVNYGGWAACDLRYDVLGSTDKAPSNYPNAKSSGCTGQDASATTATQPVAGTLMAALPEDLRAVMKPMTKYTDNVGGGTDVTGNISATLDYLPLLSEQEIFGGNRSYSNQYEKNYQAQYAYYAASNAKIKKRHDNTGTAAVWWERSPRYYSDGIFCYVDTGGGADRSGAGYSYGLAPAFKV